MSKNFLRSCHLVILLWIMLPLALLGEEATSSPNDDNAVIDYLKNLSLSELFSIDIFNPEASVAGRKTQKLMDTSSALFVITQEEIRRAGITSLPEALRLVPGVQVAKLDANKWAISARGFNQRFANKLLVMIDGRSVSSTLRSEIFWEVQDTILEDIDRIEVVRGPGAALWGANAVNGVINIITKPAKDTTGSLITSQVANAEEQNVLGIRVGGTTDAGIFYRGYGKFSQFGSFVDAQGQATSDDWQMQRGGFRVDGTTMAADTWTIQGDIYHGTANQNLKLSNSDQLQRDQSDLTGFNLLHRWRRLLPKGDMIVQTYGDFAQRTEFRQTDRRSTIDVDFQYRWQHDDQQEWLGGIGYRYTADDITGTAMISYEPPQRQDNLFSGFLQGEFKIPLPLKMPSTLTLENSVVDDAEPSEKFLQFNWGAKLEYNDYSGFELQPTLRMLWAINEQNSLWSSLSYAVRTPSRTDRNAQLTMDTVNDKLVTIQGNPNYQSEELAAYEMGYRFNLPQRLLIDTSLFYNQYNKLATYEPVTMESTIPLEIKLLADNQLAATTYGMEIMATWQATDDWQLTGTYSYLEPNFRLRETSQDYRSLQAAGNNPVHQATLRSYWNLSAQLEWDLMNYYVDQLTTGNIPSYWRLDTHLGWRPLSELELNLGVRNLLDKQHPEFGVSEGGVILSEVPRTVYLQVKYKF